MAKNEKRTSQSEQTVEKILKAARSAFAENGYSGTSVDSIARRAGVNKATLYYQIGDKDTLYANVIHRVLSGITQNVADAVDRQSEPEDKLAAYIRTIAQAVSENPELPPIMIREIASDGAHLPEVAARDIASVLRVLISILEQGRSKGVFTEAAPFLVHSMIMGTILFYQRVSPIKDRQAWISASLKAKDKPLRKGLAEDVQEMVLKAIKSEHES